jgi:potassium-transporting ATPase ATP-binding subunit
MSQNTHQPKPLFETAIVRAATVDAFKKLSPSRMIRNPVMFVVEVGSVFTTVLFAHRVVTGQGDAHPGFILAVALCLWFTVLFANFAEAMAEGRGKAQADALRKARQDVVAKRIKGGSRNTALLTDPERRHQALEDVLSSALRIDDVVFVTAGELIPADGEVVEGVASVDESAITAPLLAGRACCRTGSSCASQATPARPSWIA